MFRIFKDHIEKKRKDAHELELKKALSKKFSNYDESHFNLASDPSDNTDYTEITLGGNKLRVKKEQITLSDVTTNTVITNTWK